ncbi:MAG: proton-conducting transporter membrane subunit, partial [Desulfobacteraceae bacterium]|nr:proton-conducting transporter membrane subunit [Desulfobacteraceae bacterium]
MDLRTVLVALLVMAPVLGALLCAMLRSTTLRSAVVLSTGFVLALAALLIVPLAPFKLSGGALFGIDLHPVILTGDFLLLLVILFYGIKHRHMAIIGLGLFQVLMLLVLEFFLVEALPAFQRITCDQLAVMMVLIISIVGSIICYQAIPYMEEHERHYRPARSRQPRFFFVMLIFLGAMNGLVLFNDLTFIYFFFEATTLCSFLLIGHDRTTIATRNALRALWMNSAGGAVFILGIVAAYHATGTLELRQFLAASGPAGSGGYLLALALLCVAAFIKSAQFPFQSWLLGAMVAPTPVSALLHSSTMVKVGVYMVLRLAPGFEGTLLSQSVAVFGAFGFLAGAALAVGQSNGKKVLAYSTISNLGLIFACAGLDTAEAMTAAMLLLVFHAVIKA